MRDAATRNVACAWNPCEYRQDTILTVEQTVIEADIAVGDVVTLQDRIELMSVEGIRMSAFGLMLDCCWFDKADGLSFSSFPAHNLDVFPRPSPERAVRIGTEVRLRSRGPVMSVQGFRSKEGRRYALCVWNGPAKRERQRLFPVECLTLTLLERFETRFGNDL